MCILLYRMWGFFLENADKFSCIVLVISMLSFSVIVWCGFSILVSLSIRGVWVWIW